MMCICICKLLYIVLLQYLVPLLLYKFSCNICCLSWFSSQHIVDTLGMGDLCCNWNYGIAIQIRSRLCLLVGNGNNTALFCCRYSEDYLNYVVCKEAVQSLPSNTRQQCNYFCKQDSSNGRSPYFWVNARSNLERPISSQYASGICLVIGGLCTSVDKFVYIQYILSVIQKYYNCFI